MVGNLMNNTGPVECTIHVEWLSVVCVHLSVMLIEKNKFYTDSVLPFNLVSPVSSHFI